MAKQQIPYRMTKLDDIRPYERNPRVIPQAAVDAVARSIQAFGFRAPIIVDGQGVILAGHTRYKAAQQLGLAEVPVIWQSDITDIQARGYRIADNKVGELSAWDRDALDAEVRELAGSVDAVLDAIGLADWELERILHETDVPQDFLESEQRMSQYSRSTTLPSYKSAAAASNGLLPNGDGSVPVARLTDDFIVPPFSIFDARQGYWIARNRYWREKIGDNGESREDRLGLSFDGFKGVSILDATLAEIVCKWFSPFSSQEPIRAYDPFAGDTTFGYVAGSLGLSFTGIELRPEQVELNKKKTPENANYICDDGQNILKYLEENSQDLLFSCPPYFNLEKYSDLPNDASNQSYDGFLQIYSNVLLRALKCLKDDRFAVIIMSNVRDEAGFYYDLCSETTRIMKQGGAGLYNEIILINCVGSACLRARLCMRNRKCVKCHQEVLVYYKGDPKHIKSIFPEIHCDECPDNQHDVPEV